MNVIANAREQFKAYEKSREGLNGLTNLRSALDILYDVLEGDCPSEEKTTARNLAITHRKETLDWMQREVTLNSDYMSEIDKLDYCLSVIECYNDIDEILGDDRELKLFKKEFLIQKKRFFEPSEANIPRSELLNNLINNLPEDKQTLALDLFSLVGLDLKNEFKKKMQSNKKVEFETLKKILIKLIKNPNDLFIDFLSNEFSKIQGYGLEKEKIKIYLNNLEILDFTTPYDAPVISEPDISGKEKIYTYSVNGATAKLVIKNGSYIILKNSTAVRDERESIPENAQRKRGELIATGVLVNLGNNLLKFITDVAFASSSAASCVISASSTNGRKSFGLS